MGKASRDKRDIYYRKAKEEGWLARSAFKLLQIDEEFNIFKISDNVMLIYRGETSSRFMRSTGELESGFESKTLSRSEAIIGFKPMAPIEGVVQVQRDITNARTAETVIRHFDGGKADLVVCDGTPDVTGLHDMDEFVQSQLILAALTIVTHILKGIAKV